MNKNNKKLPDSKEEELSDRAFCAFINAFCSTMPLMGLRAYMILPNFYHTQNMETESTKPKDVAPSKTAAETEKEYETKSKGTDRFFKELGRGLGHGMNFLTGADFSDRNFEE